MNINVVFGQKIKEERRKKKISQEQLAFMAEIDRTYISDIEKGSRKVSLEICYKICKALDKPLSSMLKCLE